MPDGYNINKGIGGNGGGGDGAAATAGLAATAGTVNTGGGGGSGAGGSGNGANGGSGIVVLRWTVGTITIGAGLTGTTSSSGGYNYATITAGTGNVSWV